MALRQQLQEAEWDAGERSEEVALMAAGRGAEGEGMYGSTLLDFSIRQRAEGAGKPPSSEVPRRRMRISPEEALRLRERIQQEDGTQLQELYRDPSEGLAGQGAAPVRSSVAGSRRDEVALGFDQF